MSRAPEKAPGVFTRLYLWMMRVARDPHAPWWLGAVSFADSSFFPFPPDIMLAPMTLARPANAFRYASLTVLTSLAGALLGYAIGFFLIASLLPWIDRLGYRPAYDAIQHWYLVYGFWALIVKGVTPVPYKLFTLSAGALAMPLAPFLGASLISRSVRFFGVAYLVKWGGPPMEAKLLRHLDTLGWAITALILVGVVWWVLR